MPGLMAAIMNILSPESAEKRAEAENVARLPEGMRERLEKKLRARRKQKWFEDLPEGNKRLHTVLGHRPDETP
jgi:hypothetical protein